MAIAALPALLVFGTSDADAARPLLAELLARAPVKAGQPAMSPLALEACLRKARELDTTGTAIDYEIAAIDRETAEAMFLENQINAELPMLGGYDEPGSTPSRSASSATRNWRKNSRPNSRCTSKSKRPTTPRSPSSTATARRAFTAGDLGAVKAKLGIK